jgi:hypothetical protein
VKRRFFVLLPQAGEGGVCVSKRRMRGFFYCLLPLPPLARASVSDGRSA